jgi:hypothetical protein
VRYGYRFDAATASPDGRFAVIYERLGTKGLLLDDGQIVRELDRSFYQTVRMAASCLRIAPKTITAFSWIWHPLDEVAWFDVAQALDDPRHLDRGGPLPHSFNPGLVQESSACWLDDDRIAVAASGDPEQEEVEDDVGPRLYPRGLAVYDVVERTCLQAFQLDEPPGTILAIGGRHVLSLYRHPKLIDLAEGKIVHMWTELRSGLQEGSIMLNPDDLAKPPAMAFNAATKRFAIVNGDEIHDNRVRGSIGYWSPSSFFVSVRQPKRSVVLGN